MDQRNDHDVGLVGPHLTAQHVKILAHRRAIHAEAEHLRLAAGMQEPALEHLGEALVHVDEAAVHVAVADHCDAQRARCPRNGVVRAGRVPAFGIDSDERVAPVGVPEHGAGVRLVAYDAVDRDIRQQVVRLQDEAEDDELEQREREQQRSGDESGILRYPLETFRHHGSLRHAPEPRGCPWRGSKSHASGGGAGGSVAWIGQAAMRPVPGQARQVGSLCRRKCASA